MIRWNDTPRSLKISSLKLSGGFKARLTKPSVVAMAASTEEVGRINLPVVCWTLAKAKRREATAGEDRIAAELVRNGGKWDALIAVRTFDCDTELEIQQVRAHENAIRRHDNRDEWLAGLARATAEDSKLSSENIDAEGGAVEPGKPGVAEEATGNPGGEAAPPEALDPPDNLAQGFAGPVQQQAGSPPVPPAGADPHAHWCILSPSHRGACLDSNARPEQIRWADPSMRFEAPPAKQAVTVETPKAKAERRKQAAALATEATGKTVTPAAVKQAEHRERKKAGLVNPRQKHEDAGPALGPLGEEVGRAFLDVHRFITDAVTRLSNLAKKHPELGERFPVAGWLAALKEAGKGIKAATPDSPCVFCFGQGPKASCQVCRGQRWGTAQELKEAPAEMRKAAGL
jgi:hypothetical protein